MLMSTEKEAALIIQFFCYYRDCSLQERSAIVQRDKEKYEAIVDPIHFEFNRDLKTLFFYLRQYNDLTKRTLGFEGSHWVESMHAFEHRTGEWVDSNRHNIARAHPDKVVEEWKLYCPFFTLYQVIHSIDEPFKDSWPESISYDEEELKYQMERARIPINSQIYMPHRGGVKQYGMEDACKQARPAKKRMLNRGEAEGKRKLLKVKIDTLMSMETDKKYFEFLLKKIKAGQDINDMLSTALNENGKDI